MINNNLQDGLSRKEDRAKENSNIPPLPQLHPAGMNEERRRDLVNSIRIVSPYFHPPSLIINNHLWVSGYGDEVSSYVI